MSNGFIFLHQTMMGEKNRFNPGLEDISIENINPKKPVLSAWDLGSRVSKQIISGSQENPWNPDNLLNDDGNYDSTRFKDAPTHRIDIQSLTSQYVKTGGEYQDGSDPRLYWGTTAGRSVQEVLQFEDDRFLYLENEEGSGFPGMNPAWIYMRWGHYPNFEEAIHPHVYRIMIEYTVMCDTVPSNPLIGSTDLRLCYILDNGYEGSFQIADTVIGQRYYWGIKNLHDSVLINHILHLQCLFSLNLYD